MHSDKRILDPKEAGTQGQVITVDPAPVTSNEAAASLLRIQRTIRGKRVDAVNRHEASIVTLAVEAVPENFNVLPGIVLLQGILQFGSGAGQQGMQPSGDLSFAGGATFDGRIIFDIQLGTMLSFPTSFFALDYLYTHVYHTGEAPATSDPLGPTYQVSFSLGYEPTAGNQRVTCTQFPDGLNLVSSGAANFTRPQFADSLYLMWHEWDTIGPLTLRFFGSTGTEEWETFYVGGGGNGDPPRVIPWPADAVAVIVQNTTDVELSDLRVVNNLQF